MTTEDAAGWVPDSCSLPSAELPLRVAEFDALFRDSLVHWVRTSATRLQLTLSADSEPTARDLSARETECCSFFSFTFEPRPSALVMGIEVPESQVAVLDALVARVAVVHSQDAP